MNQININPAPAISMRIHKNTEISWSSENVTNNTNPKVKKDSKKKK